MTTKNPELELAEQYVRDTGCHIFLTGRAGTGKTTFLRNLKKSSAKRTVVTAPTGVAAINAGGVTLHSFFQLPFGPFVPGSTNSQAQYRFRRTKIDIIKNLDLLIIDEISMVRADLLDGVDEVLRRHRRNDRPFGGVQMVLIGDLFQLPPVVKEEDWETLKPYYATPYFFSSKALEKTKLVSIELAHIYRQVDSRFIDLLNRVRNDTLDTSSLAELNNRHITGFTPQKDDGTITLCTHNRNADRINASRLQALKGELHIFSARVEGEFPVHTYPTASVLKLKAGAQVMFIRNDRSPEKQYFNGKIGKITRITDDTIRIQCPDDTKEIIVEPETWENIEYQLDKKTLEITESTVGGFTQYPLRLAWAISIHKSQGLTFDRAVIDAKAAFAHGQVYVALSRCRTLDGMVLSTPLGANTMKVDPAVRQFSREAQRNQPTLDQLCEEKIRYQQTLLIECFDFQRLRDLLHQLTKMVMNNTDLIKLVGVPDLTAIQQTSESEIFFVGDKFIRQLTGLFSTLVLPSQDNLVLDRIAKASAYFQEKLSAGLCRYLPQMHVETDNRALEKKAGFILKLATEEAAVKKAAVGSCADGFSPSRYFRALSEGSMGVDAKKKPVVSPTYSEADISHPELFADLKAWRSRQAKKEGLALYQVLHQKTLIQIAVHLPDTIPALKKIRGIGKKLANRYGAALVDKVQEYRKKHDIQTVILAPPVQADSSQQKARTQEKSKKKKIDTKQATLDLFEKGLTLQKIAEARGLVVATIEGHMSHWVKNGKVTIDALLVPEKKKAIEKALTRMPGKSFSEIKQVLGADFSYGEIRLVQAHLDAISQDSEKPLTKKK